MDYISKEDNHTRWNTDDLNNFVAAVQECRHRFEYVSGGEDVEITKVENLYGSTETGRLGETFVKYGTSVLKLRSSTFLEGEDNGLHNQEKMEFVAAFCDDPIVMPAFMKRDLFLALTRTNHRFVGVPRWRRVAPDHDAMTRDFLLVENVAIRLMPKVEAGPNARNRLSEEEKKAQQIARYRNWYGEGGELVGVDWGWRTGHRAATGQWKWPIEATCRYFYETELAARNQHARKIVDLGGEAPPPYENYSDFLRRMADELDNKTR